MQQLVSTSRVRHTASQIVTFDRKDVLVSGARKAIQLSMADIWQGLH
jgi:hypothetical protein